MQPLSTRCRAGRIVAAALITAGLTALAVNGSTVAGADTCPSSNPPNTMTASAGTPQTTKIGTAFPTNLQVRFTSSDACPVTTGQAGIAVTFTAPASGPSGTFATTGTRTATVGSDSSATATAPTFTANDTAGNFTVVATSAYGSATFSLTTTSTGVAATITAAGGTPQSAPVTTDYPRALQAKVLDSAGNPVQGANVIFSLGSNGTGPTAAFLTGGPNPSATTNTAGLVTSPPFTANSVAGTFTATAATAGVARPATYSLRNTAASPATLTAGAGSSQGTPAGSPFPIPLAICLDPFHAMKWVNEALEVVYRSTPFAELGLGGGNRTWRRARTALRTGEERLDDDQRSLVAKIRRRRYALWRAWELKEQFRALYKNVDPSDARSYLKAWCTAALRSRIPAFRTLVKRVRKHFDGLVAAVEWGLSNSRLEGINAKIRLINNRAHGHKTADGLTASIYLGLGGITVQLPTQR